MVDGLCHAGALSVGHASAGASCGWCTGDAGYRSKMPRDTPISNADDQPVEEIAEDIAETNRDETTRREAFELELEERGRSDEGAEVGDHIE